MAIVTFGSKGEESRVCEVVNVFMQLRSGGSRDLTVFVVPIICEALTCQPITLCRDRYTHIAGLPLADLSDGSDALEVDILIGCDHYWSFITGEIKRGDEGPTPSLDGYCQGQLGPYHTLELRPHS